MKKGKRILIIWTLLISAVILTVFSQRATQYARDALKVCALSVIPSLFPYMVISHMIVSGGVCDTIAEIFPVSRLLKLPSSATAPLLLGALCGFPVGAKSAVTLYEKGEMTKEQTEVLISYANNTGPSFIVSVIGAVMWNSTLFGTSVYIFQLISAFLAATLVNRVLFPYSKDGYHSLNRRAKYPSFFSAVAESSHSVLTVCGFIVFFSVISGFLLPILSKLSPRLSILFCSLLEFTGGARLGASVGGMSGAFITGLSVGFSGICVLCQTAAFTSKAGLSLRRTVCTKIIQGLLCAGMCALFANFRKTACVGALYVDGAQTLVSHNSPLAISLLSLICYLFIIKNASDEHKM